MTDSIHERDPHSFYHRPEWRWLRAKYLHQTGRRLDRRIDDNPVAAARNLLARRDCRRSEVSATNEAHGVWTGCAFRRGECEARLLTDAPMANIADKLGLSASVIEAYHTVFFEVRPKKKATDWLMHQAIGYSPFRGIFGPMPFAAWKLAAHVGGPHWLEQTITATRAQPLPSILPTDLDLTSFMAMKSQRRVELWIQLADAVTDAKLQSFLRDVRRYRDWVTCVTGTPHSVPPSQLACEEFLLRLKDHRTSDGREHSEAERPHRMMLKSIWPPCEPMHHDGATVDQPLASTADRRTQAA